MLATLPLNRRAAFWALTALLVAARWMGAQ